MVDSYACREQVCFLSSGLVTNCYKNGYDDNGYSKQLETIKKKTV